MCPFAAVALYTVIPCRQSGAFVDVTNRLFENWKNAKVDSIDEFLENAPVMMHSTDSTGCLAHISAPWAARLGYDVSEVLGKRLPDLMTPDSKYRALTQEIPRFLRTGKVENIEYDFICRDGSVLPVLMSSIARYNSDGSFANSLAVVSDNTANKFLSMFERKAEKAERENTAKTRFLANMSHELRTPLNAIIGFAQMINGQTGPLTDEQRVEYSGYIMESGDRLLKLINQVLDLSSIESGGGTVTVDEVDISPLIHTTMNEVSVLAHPRNIALHDLTDKSPLPPVLGDEGRLRQTLVNLVANAVKYNRENGRVSISAATTGRALRVSVRDTGHGIEASRHAEVFETFNRLGAEATNLEGSGIGLSIAKEYIERMGGRIGFSSRVGVGSTFWIELPLAGEVDELDAEAEWARSGAKPFPVAGSVHRVKSSVS